MKSFDDLYMHGLLAVNRFHRNFLHYSCTANGMRPV
jgi:hypothetical protein